MELHLRDSLGVLPLLSDVDLQFVLVPLPIFIVLLFQLLQQFLLHLGFGLQTLKHVQPVLEVILQRTELPLLGFVLIPYFSHIFLSV